MRSKPLRSQAWFGGTGKDAFIHRLIRAYSGSAFGPFPTP